MNPPVKRITHHLPTAPEPYPAFIHPDSQPARP